MKNLIRRWLGLDIDQVALHKHLADLHDEMIGMRSDLASTFKDEFDPKRQEMSNRLAQRAIERLKGEDAARRLTTDGNA